MNQNVLLWRAGVIVWLFMNQFLCFIRQKKLDSLKNSYHRLHFDIVIIFKEK